MKDTDVCKRCNGQGQFQEQELVDGDYQMVTYFCEACEGTGLEPTDGDMD